MSRRRAAATGTPFFLMLFQEVRRHGNAAARADAETT